MLKNHLKTALRSLFKNKGFTFINVFGLALGLATCLLLLFYVFDELSYDRFNTNADRIYRVDTELKYGGTVSSFAIAAPAVGGALVKEFPEVAKATRLQPAINIHFKKGTAVIEEHNTVYCDPALFDIFTLPMLEGNAGATKEHNLVVVTASTAKKYFNTTQVVGKLLVMENDSVGRKISGVIQDIPSASHFKADIFLILDPNTDNNWSHFSTNTYVLLRQGANVKTLQAKLDPLLRRNITTPAFNYDKFAAKGSYIKLSLIPLTDIHLRSNKQRELGPNGDVQYVYIFSATAIFVLLLACINFMNLSTARSARRAREVGVYKVLGASRMGLVVKFLSESVLITLAATVIGVLFAWALLPWFNDLAGKDLHLTLQTLSWLVPALLIMIVVVGVLAGYYPAVFLSAFKPINVLKGKLATGFKGGALRNFLVVFQFGISIFLIVGTLVIYGQLKFIQSKDLGFDRNQVLIVKNANVIGDPSLLKNQIKQLPGVINASPSSFLPTNTIRWPNSISSAGGQNIQTEFWTVDDDYITTMGMKIMQGRNFSKDMITDSSAIILNETAAKMLGYKGGPLEKLALEKYHVIGVVKDFNFSSLRDNITPLVMVRRNDWMASLNVKVNTANLATVMTQVQARWKALAPNRQFEYVFMNDEFNALYANEQRMGKLFVWFTSLAIIIACLGLFGLSAYAAEQRNQEIGIRKVIGADVLTLVIMLSKDFLKLVFVAILIATPLAWLAMHKWLQGFAYRQDIQWWVLVFTALVAFLIAFVTVSFQSIKAARLNPVKILRSE